MKRILYLIYMMEGFGENFVVLMNRSSFFLTDLT